MSEPKNHPRSTWLMLEAQEIIELKRAIQDRDSQEAMEFFQRIILPRAREAARQRGISLEDAEEGDGHLPG